jgi:hypothetical protein
MNWNYFKIMFFSNRIEEVKMFVTGLKPSGGTNMLKSLRRILNVHNVDSIVLIIGSV